MTLLDIESPTLRQDRLAGLPIAIVGAGPVGLAAAANLVERGLEFVVFEAGDAVATDLRSWGHIRLFSPWRHLIDPAARRLLEASGWAAPRNLDRAPSGAELVRDYLEPLAEVDGIRSRIRTGLTVEAITREGMDRTRSTNRAETPFALRVRDRAGEVADIPARAVIDASGTYRRANGLASNGLDPLGAADVSEHITHALPDVIGAERERFLGKHITVVGAGHSAANTLINLSALVREDPATRVTWVIRNANAARVFTAENDELPGRASLGAKVRKLVDFGIVEVRDRFEIVRLERDGERAAIVGNRTAGIVRFSTDVIVNATGFRPDLDMLSEIRLELDEVVEAPRRLAPLIDPNLHSCGTVEPHGFAELQQPEPNFFIAGMKSYGRAPTFLLATGYEQVRSITAWLDGDLAAASKVELVLPATGGVLDIVRHGRLLLTAT
jgi:thioredoxin reductase